MRLSHFLTVLPVCIMLAIGGGCSKKQTKVDVPEPVEQIPEPEPEPPVIEAPVEPVFDPASVLQPVYFDYDQSSLRPEAISTLETIGKMLMEHPNVRLMVEGHADERGSAEYNMGLGESRATSVKRWLVNYGVSGDQLETVSYGKERPVNPACDGDDSCHAMNRRVEFRVTMQ